MAHSAAFTGLQGHSVGAFFPVRVVGVGDLWRVKDAANVTVWNSHSCHTAHVVAQLLHDTANSYSSDSNHGYRLFCEAVRLGLIAPLADATRLRVITCPRRNIPIYSVWFESSALDNAAIEDLANNTPFVVDTGYGVKWSYISVTCEDTARALLLKRRKA